jgi:lysosomal acid lipase/cholesteryl ester hydrolase
LRLKPSDSRFWDFSLDEIALHDVPAIIAHVLEHAAAPTLAYVAFSQGSAVGFACFSLQRKVAAQVNVFVALSPAAKARGLQRGFLQSVIHVAPKTLFLVFGARPLLLSKLRYLLCAVLYLR